MKTQYLLLFIALLFCGKAAYAQGITYEKIFGGPGNGEFYSDIKEMKKDGYLITGSTNSFGAGNYDAYCIRMNKEGKMLWSKTYGTSFSEANTKCWGTSDGGFILAFSSHNSTYQYGDTISSIFIVKCNVNGNIEWSKCIKNIKKINKAFFITPKYIYESKNGDIYLLSDWFSFDYAPQFTLLKINATGKLLWEKSISVNTSYDYTSSQILESNDGDIIVSANAHGNNWSTYGAYIHLFSFSQQTGAINLSKAIYQTYNGGYSAYLKAYNIVIDSNKLHITGTYSEQGFYDNICWFSITPGNTKLKANYIAYNNLYSYQYLANKKFIKQSEEGFDQYSIFTKDGGLLYADQYLINKPTYNVDIGVFKYDSLGRICPKFATPVIDTTVHETSFRVADLSYSLNEHPITITDSLVTVTDVTAERTICEGTAPVITDKIENTSSVVADKISEAKLQLYPNPANDFVNINFEVNKPATIQFNIINTEGKIVLTKQLFASIGKQQTTLNIQSLPPGAYYIKIIGLIKPAAIQFLKIK